MEVRFTEWAENCLNEIYNHYSEKASPDIAANIVNRIIERAETLVFLPERGEIEKDLLSLGKGHRYLLEYHYKIVYVFEGGIVTVTDIFSNYQNPSRKQGRNK